MRGRAPSAAGSVHGGTPPRSCVARPTVARDLPSLARRAAGSRCALERGAQSSRAALRALGSAPHIGLHARALDPAQRRPARTRAPAAIVSRRGGRTRSGRDAHQGQNISPVRARSRETPLLARSGAAAAAARSGPAGGRTSKPRALKTMAPNDLWQPSNAAGKKKLSYAKKVTLVQQHTPHNNTQFFFGRLPAKAKGRGSPGWTSHGRSNATTGAAQDRSDAHATQLPAVEHQHVRHETAGLSGAHVLDPARPAEGGSYFC